MGNLEKRFVSAVEKHAPLATITLKGNNLPYITTDMQRMIRQQDYLRGKANKIGVRNSQAGFQQIINKVPYAIIKAKSEYFTEKLVESKGDLKET